jgi:hypothetical protein
MTVAKEGLLLVGSAPTLELSRVAEVAGYWPLSNAKRVRRVMGLPVLYVGDPFAPRRARATRAAAPDPGWRMLLMPYPNFRSAPALRASRTPGGLRPDRVRTPVGLGSL